MDKPIKISSQLLRTNLWGGSCNRELTNLKTALNTLRIENTNKNRYAESMLHIIFRFFCALKFLFLKFVKGL
jgi:hypothetical protein